MVAKTQRSGMGWLKKLDQAVFNWLRNLDVSTANKLERLDNIVYDGASKRIVKKRTGNWFGDRLSSLWFRFWQLLDKLDTRFFYQDRPYQAKVCRVRSRSEKRIANWLTDRGIKFKYEKPLRLGKVTLHPDFFLTKYKVYLEYWGLADSDPDYHAQHKAKLRLYRKHEVPVISVYPRHLKQGLDSVFPQLFQEVTGRELP